MYIVHLLIGTYFSNRIFIGYLQTSAKLFRSHQLYKQLRWTQLSQDSFFSSIYKLNKTQPIRLSTPPRPSHPWYKKKKSNQWTDGAQTSLSALRPERANIRATEFRGLVNFRPLPVIGRSWGRAGQYHPFITKPLLYLHKAELAARRRKIRSNASAKSIAILRIAPMRHRKKVVSDGLIL